MNQQRQVKVYSSPTCPWCKRVKEFLKMQGVAFEDIDVVSDKDARQEMVAKTGQMGVPVIEVDGDYVIGYDEGKLKEKLAL
jgi:glutaredoxin-like YruB-family protein